MKKIFIVLSFLLLTGCTALNNTPKIAVEDLIKKYQVVDEDVVASINEMADKEEFKDTQKDTYKDIIKEQFKSLIYEIKEDKINGDDAYVTVQITVKDLYKAKNEADLYIADNTDKFENTDKINEYKLEMLKKAKEKVTYTLEFKTKKINNKWIVSKPNDLMLSKMTGTYAY